MKSFIKSIIKEFGENVWMFDGKVLVCKLCTVKITLRGRKRDPIIKHICTDKHKKNVELVEKKQLSRQSPFQLSTNVSEFDKDLCRALVSANIPIYKVNNKCFKEFLEKYTFKSVPCESALRRTYLPKVYEETVSNIRRIIGSKNIYVQLDETTDIQKRSIMNCIVGVLNGNENNAIFLLNCECMEKVDNVEVCKFLDRSLRILYPDGIKNERLLLILTDAAPYMKAAARGIRMFYENCIHLTCLAHGMHNVAEKVKDTFETVNELISVVKKVFLKSPSRVRKFRELCPDVPLPPQPICTRWGTWIRAAMYHCDYFEDVKKVVEEISPSAAASVMRAKILFENMTLKNDLAFIKMHFGFLPNCITNLEKRNLALHESVKIVDDVENKLKMVPSKAGVIVYEKFQQIIAKNAGFEILKNISNSNLVYDDLIKDISPANLFCLKYAPITSVEVERSFSLYKRVLTDRRTNLTLDNLKMHVVSCANIGIVGNSEDSATFSDEMETDDELTFLE